MCGRTVSTLNGDQYRRACTYTNRRGRRMRPGWRNRGPRGGGTSRSGGGGGGGGGGSNRQGSDASEKQHSQHQVQSREGTKTYFPSFNMSPQQATPVLVSRKHFVDKSSTDETSLADERDLMPMTWGLVPSWHKGTAKDMTYKMNNCRSEGMFEKASFKRPFEKGQRCVVLADGFYEWKTDKTQKQPYFIYFTQEHPPTDLAIVASHDQDDDEGCDGVDEVPSEPCEVSEGDAEWTGHRLLTMAGLFDKWTPPDGGDPVYTYTVITVESNDSFSWLHHRMPAVLEGDEEIAAWLDMGSFSSNQAAKSLISARRCLSCHPVTKSVGNVRYKDPDCIKPIELGKPEVPKKSPGNSFMASWLARGSKATDGKSSPLKAEGGMAGREEPMGKKKKREGGTLAKWFVKKEEVAEEEKKEEVAREQKKRSSDDTVKEEQPSPKRIRVL